MLLVPNDKEPYGVPKYKILTRRLTGLGFAQQTRQRKVAVLQDEVRYP